MGDREHPSSVAQNGRVFIVTPTLNYKRPDNFANGTLMMPFAICHLPS